MNALVALVGVAALVLVGLVGYWADLEILFGVALPGAALLIFLVGIVWRVIGWARSPVPFKITTTCGQHRSLDWLPRSRFDCPSSRAGAFWRMAGEIVLFRSLFRNTKATLTPDGNLVYGSHKWLWLASIAFHYSFLVVVLRHLRFFVEPVPGFVAALESVDGFFQIGVPTFYLTSLALVAALLFLLGRRLVEAQVRYLSLPADYFALLLILGIAISGILLRHTPLRTDVVQVKELATGIWTFDPAPLQGASGVFFVHLFLVSSLLAYFPFSKLVHAPGVFFSPTRNLPNDNRARRHVNPWADELPQKTHTYEEWEEEFAEVMKAAGFELQSEKHAAGKKD